MGRPFFDTDALVVKSAGIPIATIFAELGEPAFRALEADALAAAARTPGAIVALGGGTVLAPQNRALIVACGRSIHLRATVATLERRVKAQRVTRPLLAAGTSVGTLLAARLPLYSCADHTVDVDRRSLDDIVAEIRTLL
jgi:shikimate kinase